MVVYSYKPAPTVSSLWEDGRRVLGSYDVITDANGNVVERLSFDAWGNRRNPIDWREKEAPGTPHLFSRGFTGHEHLDKHGVINMNGRLYDPTIGRFFSPDPFVADATSTQDYNRYSYARNNPLMYIDPSGENPFIVAAIIGFVANIIIEKYSGNLNSTADFWTAGLLGAAGGVFGSAAGVAIAGATGTTGFAAGAITGAVGGFSGGFISGAGNAWIQGVNFEDGLLAGFKAGMIGGITGGIVGGVFGEIRYRREIEIFRKGCYSLSINEGDPVPATDDFLRKAQEVWIKDAPMEKVGDFTTENIPKSVNMVDKNGNPAYGRTIPRVLNSRFTGISDMYFSEMAFSSAKQLFVTMGHEFVHVNQFVTLAGQSSLLLKNTGFIEFIEHQAYQYDNTFLNRVGNSFDKSLMRSFSTKYPNVSKLLNFDAVYRNLPWKLPEF